MTKTSHIPTRMCVVCMQMKPKADLIRLVKDSKGNIIIDYSQKMGGRGVWVDKCPECIQLLKKHKCLERKFQSNVPNEIFEELSKIANG